MKQYFLNLLEALWGNNPYRRQLDALREQMEKAGDNVNTLRDSYYKEVARAADAEQKYGEAAALLAEYQEKLEKAGKQVASLQKLVENLRERIKDYQQRQELYNIGIDKILNKN